MGGGGSLKRPCGNDWLWGGVGGIGQAQQLDPHPHPYTHPHPIPLTCLDTPTRTYARRRPTQPHLHAPPAVWPTAPGS